MNKNYFIKNSLAPRQSLAFKVHRQPVHSRSAEGPTVSFDYDQGKPSYPKHHLLDNTQQIYIEPVEGAESYTLHCSGTVDDHAEDQHQRGRKLLQRRFWRRCTD